MSEVELNTPLIVAFVAAAVTAVGWMVNFVLSGYRERQKQRATASLKFIERQLEELYGPLAFLILEGKRSMQDLREQVDRDVLPSNNISTSFESLTDKIQREKQSASVTKDEKYLPLWIFWAENDFLPRNEKMKELLMNKTHLIDGDRMPESYLLFINHVDSWRLKHLRWLKERVPYSWHSKTLWPAEFDEEVLNTFEKLKKQHTCFLQKIS